MAYESCPDCGSKNLRRDYERGEIICTRCGLVVAENVVDEGPEWRAFDAEQRDKRARGGAPIKYMRPNKGLVTEIDQYNRDIRGARISTKKQAQLYRMRKWHKRASIATSMERNLAIALSELDRVGSYLGLPESVREACALLYRKCVEKGLIRGRLIENVVSAVIYAVCRNYKIPRTLDEISEISGVPKKEIGRTYRFITTELDIKIPLSEPRYYVPRFATALKLSGKTQEKAIELLNKSVKRGLISGRGPTGVAAAAVYIAASLVGERRTQKEVADVAGVTEVTIRNRYRELKKELKLKIDL
ncbi:MAG: transcription initiation factor IIB [Candidatus Micrarchaeia archaeon]